MNVSFSSPAWKNTSFNHTCNFNTSGMLNTSIGFRQHRDNFIMSTLASYVLEPFGAPLPSMVKSLLNQATEGQKISCRVDPNGWAWLVSGRKLYIWRHSFSNDSKRSNIIACRELCLPTSELAHQAQLVCIVTNSSASSSVPACIAVSPEGQITYWPNISNDSGTITISADIPGQECESLSSLWPHACILTTTTSTVLLVKPILASGNKPSLSCLPLVLHKGWLGGLGRKVTSMLFNPIPTSGGNETKKAKVAVPISKDDLSQPGAHNPFVYILHGTLVQTWTMSIDQQLSQSNAVNLEDTVRRFFLQYAWSSEIPSEGRSQPVRIQVWLLDIDVLPNQNLAVLTAAVNTTDPNLLIYYGIVTMNPRDVGRESPSFTLVNYTTNYTPCEDEQRISELQNWKILAVSNFFCMLSPETIVIISDRADASVDTIDGSSSGGHFLGYSRVSDGTIAVFAPKIGIMSLKGTMVDNLLDDSYTDFVRVPDNLAAEITQANFEDLPLSDDNVNRLKTAFLAFIAKKNTECQEIINSLFPATSSSWTPDESIDLIALALCDKLIDDAPSSDQRGKPSYASSAEPDHLGFKSKQLVLKCLANKKDVLELFVGFLSNVGLLQQLTRIVMKEDTIATATILYNSYEKIGFALALHQLQSESQYRASIESAIKFIVKSRSEKESQVRSSHLSTNEQFYKDVSRVHQIIKGLVLIEEEQLSTALPHDMPEIVHTVNEIILKALCDMSIDFLADKLPAMKASLITPLMQSSVNEFDVLNWVVEPRVLTYLLKQHHFIVQNGLNVTEDAGIQATLLKDLNQFTDLILNGLKQNLESIQNSDRYNQRLKRFEELRYTLLREFIDVKDYDGAIAMAEKYVDFEIIVDTCYTKGDFVMFDHYFEKYANSNFAEFTFEWFVKQKKQDELVSSFTKSVARSKLTKFLESHPEMSWHFKSIIEDYKGASNTLSILANSEEASTQDQKFYLRLSKLALLASGVPAEEIDGNSYFDDCESDMEQDDLEKLSVLSLYEGQDGRSEDDILG